MDDVIVFICSITNVNIESLRSVYSMVYEKVFHPFFTLKNEIAVEMCADDVCERTRDFSVFHTVNSKDQNI